VSSNPVHGEVYSIQHYVIKFAGTPVSSTNKTAILLKVALNTMNLNHQILTATTWHGVVQHIFRVFLWNFLFCNSLLFFPTSKAFSAIPCIMYSVITSCLGDLYSNAHNIHYLIIKSSTIRIIIFTHCAKYTCIFLRNFINNVYFTILLLKSKNSILYYRIGTTVSLLYIFQVYISCCVTYKVAFCNEIQALQAQQY
jgi:hypothetical protein